MSITDLAREREKHGIPADGNVNGRSIAERGGDEPDLGETEDMFELDQGRRVELRQLIPKGTTIEYKVTLNAKSIKGGGDMGLLSFNDPEMILVVSAREGDVKPSPTYDEDGNLEKVTLYVNFKPQAIHAATSREGRALLGLEEA